MVFIITHHTKLLSVKLFFGCTHKSFDTGKTPYSVIPYIEIVYKVLWGLDLYEEKKEYSYKLVISATTTHGHNYDNMLSCNVSS